MSGLRREYKKISKKIHFAEMQDGSYEEEITLESLISFGRIQSNSCFFLEVFSKQGLMNLLNKFHLLEVLNKKGLDNISTELDTSDSRIHRMYIYTGEQKPANIICELVARKSPQNFSEEINPGLHNCTSNILQIEWLLLQNPKKVFAQDRPRLPGQSRPGLGLGRNFLELMIIMANFLSLDGITNKPHFFHTAFMFTKEFIFVNPEKQAIIEMICKDLLPKYPFYNISWAANFNCIVNTKTNEPFTWEPDVLILPLKKKLVKYFHSREYKKTVHLKRNNYSFAIDFDKFKNAMKEHDLKIL